MFSCRLLRFNNDSCSHAFLYFKALSKIYFEWNWNKMKIIC